MLIKDKMPAPHARYVVRRNEVICTATPCYGMHSPWWVTMTFLDFPKHEVEPVPMKDTDEWWLLDRTKITEELWYEVETCQCSNVGPNAIEPDMPVDGNGNCTYCKKPAERRL